jgi:hypothetical protein
VGQGLLIKEASRSHPVRKPHSVGLCTSDRPVADRPLPDKTQQSQETAMPRAGFEPAILPSERLRTQALYRTVNGTGCSIIAGG